MKRYVVKKDEIKQVVIKDPGKYLIDLVGEGARVEILGGFLVDGNQDIKVVVEITHKASNTKADTILKAVVGGKSSVDIRGKIVVEKGASQTESYLQERVLLISKTAKATAIPDLEIHANEVKCSHAAAVSSVDKEQVYYLMSRGLNERQASKMIVDGFLNEVWKKVDGKNDKIDPAHA